MRKVIPILLMIVVLLSCDKDDEEIKQTKSEPTYYTFNGVIGTNDNSTIVSNDDNLIICGNSGYDISVLKISKSGTEIWRIDFDAGKMSEARSLVQNSNNDIFICGKTNRNHSDTRKDILLIKMNSQGDTAWTKTFGGDEPDYGTNIITTTDGNLLISGKTESFGAGSWGDIYLLKINFDGDTLWTKRYSDQGQDIPYSLIETTNGEYLVTGANWDDSNPCGLYLLKVSSEGEKLWDKTFGAGLWKWGFSTIELANEDLLTCGQYTYAGFSKVLVLKTDKFGNLIWEMEYGDEGLSGIGNAIKKNLDETFTIIGSSNEINTMQSDIMALKIDQDGDQVWVKNFGTQESDWAKNLIIDSNGDILITGEYEIASTDQKIFLTILDKDGNFK